MKRKLLQVVICVITLSMFTPAINAQQFKWVKGGGTAEDLSLSGPYGYNNSEEVYNICSDANRNVYAVTVVGHDDIIADTFDHTAAYESHSNLLITSYNCNGEMRWAKLISVSNEALPYSITADNLGHIYVAGFFDHTTGSHGLKIGNDTTITGSLNQRNAVIQFDTSGQFKWIRMVGDNSASTLFGSYSFGSALAIDGTNNIHFLNYTKSGVVLTPSVTSLTGVYDIMYNSAGTLISATKLEIDSSYYVSNGAIEPVTNKLFICGERNGSVYTSFAGSFDAYRNKIWMDTLASSNSYFSSIAYDYNGHLYFNGGGTPDFSFRGHSVTNTHYPTYFNITVVMKTDTSGHPIWIKKIDGNEVDGYTKNSITITGNRIATTGIFSGEIIDGVDSIIAPVSEAQNPFLEILDTAGNLVTLQQIHGDGFSDGGNSITSDSRGNIYIGGRVEDSIKGGSIPAYHSHGGNSDFFVMKYGYDCTCGAVLSNFTSSGAHSNITFSYTGTTTMLDSVVWDFGDGVHDTGSNPSHIYATTGIYTVCVTAVTNCGSSSNCHTIAVTEGVHNVAAFPGLKVYPNPISNTLFIENAGKGSTARIYDIVGQLLNTWTLNNNKELVTTGNLASGNYILQLTDASGNRMSMIIVK